MRTEGEDDHPQAKERSQKKLTQRTPIVKLQTSESVRKYVSIV